MAIGDEIFIADKATLDAVKAKTDSIPAVQADVAAIKMQVLGGTVTSTDGTQASDNANVVVNISGAGELLSLQNTDPSGQWFTIQLDGATNRRKFFMPASQFCNVKDMGFKFTTSLKVASASALGHAIYRLG